MLRILSLTFLLLWVLAWFFPLMVLYLFKKKKLRGKMMKLVFAGMLFICRIEVKKIGEISIIRPLLMISNHLSYLDIPVLGSLVDCRFVPKKEIARWPFIGQVCKMIDVVFVDRTVGKISEGNAAIAQVLSKGEIVALFPEGTTGDGKRLLPFKPAFFEAAQGVMMQPVAIAYRKVRGLPIDYGMWPMVAWYGDMLLVPHLWKLLSLGRIQVEVHFLPTIPSLGADRKDLANQSFSAVEAALLGKS